MMAITTNTNTGPPWPSTWAGHPVRRCGGWPSTASTLPLGSLNR